MADNMVDTTMHCDVRMAAMDPMRAALPGRMVDSVVRVNQILGESQCLHLPGLVDPLLKVKVKSKWAMVDGESRGSVRFRDVTFQYFAQIWIQINSKWQEYTQIRNQQIVFMQMKEGLQFTFISVEVEEWCGIPQTIQSHTNAKQVEW